ncbi:MAG TPA: hypothetical protein GX509_03195 [Firmicutes bacterium]|nr:hypothetical protein [Bacillota bacterium]HHY97727.1 hypothetical protein [Bacillota bacterium]
MDLELVICAIGCGNFISAGWGNFMVDPWGNFLIGDKKWFLKGVTPDCQK